MALHDAAAAMALQRVTSFFTGLKGVPLGQALKKLVWYNDFKRGTLVEHEQDLEIGADDLFLGGRRALVVSVCDASS